MPTSARDILTPVALATIDVIARTGSFAAAARELGKVPSALTYSVRQIEDALDVLLFDRSSRQAQLTAAGEELLLEGRRLLHEVEAVANRVRRVATGWEPQLTIAVDTIVAPSAVFDLIDAFQSQQVKHARAATRGQPDPAGQEVSGAPPTRLRVLSEALSGTWESLFSGEADLLIGGAGEPRASAEIRFEPMGELMMVFAVAPHHPLAQAEEPLGAAVIAPHRIVAVSDSARRFAPMNYGVQAGQDVLSVPSMAAKLEAQLRGLGCGWLPEPAVRRQVQAGRLVLKQTEPPRASGKLYYAWRQPVRGRPGLALQWWLEQLRSPVTRQALHEQHAGLLL